MKLHQQSGTSLFAVAMVLAMCSADVQAAEPATTCEAGKLKIASKYSSCRLKADAKAVTKNEAPDYSKCELKFADMWAKAQSKAEGACPANNDKPTVRSVLVQCTANAAGIVAGLPFCSGVQVGGSCWFLGGDGLDCEVTCATVGLVYDDATRTFAGSGGTDANCSAVMDALGTAPGAASGGACGPALGCNTDTPGSFVLRCTSPDTTSSAAALGFRRACACS